METKIRGWVVKLTDDMYLSGFRYDNIHFGFTTLDARKYIIEARALEALKRARRSEPFPEAKVYLVNREGHKAEPYDDWSPYKRQYENDSRN